MLTVLAVVVVLAVVEEDSVDPEVLVEDDELEVPLEAVEEVEEEVPEEAEETDAVEVEVGETELEVEMLPVLAVVVEGRAPD